jgi:gluconokinase
VVDTSKTPGEPTAPGQIAVVMGVAGCGKSTLAEALAEQLNWKHLDADDFHPRSNIEKMRAGTPFTDEDRYPWLESIRAELDRIVAQGNSAVLACSALKRSYRDILRATRAPVLFVLLQASRQQVAERLAKRSGHFFPAALLDSQLAALEPPDSSEPHVVVPAFQPVADMVEAVRAALR